MNSRNVFFISLAANVVLACVVALIARQRLLQKSPETVTVVTNVVTNVVAALPQTNAVETTNPVPARFDWSNLESDDYPTYVANLRAIGCPEQTIRNIIIPDVEAVYAKKQFALGADTNFWLNGRARAEFNRARTLKAMGLETEETEVIRSLLGVDWARRRDASFLASARSVFIPFFLTPTISLEKAKDLSTLLQKYETLCRQVRAEARQMLLPEDEARLHRLEQQFEDDAVRLMSPTEFAEFKLRLSSAYSFEAVRNLKDAGLVLSPDEIRRMVQIRAAGSDPLTEIISGFRSDRPASSLEERVAQKEAVANMEAILGEQRFAQFQMASDDAMKAAMRFATQNNLTITAGRAIYDIRQAAEDRAMEMRADSSLTPSQLRKQLKEIRTTTETTLVEALGESRMKQYRESYGGWLVELSRNN